MTKSGLSILPQISELISLYVSNKSFYVQKYMGYKIYAPYNLGYGGIPVWYIGMTRKELIRKFINIKPHECGV